MQIFSDIPNINVYLTRVVITAGEQPLVLARGTYAVRITPAYAVAEETAAVAVNVQEVFHFGGYGI